MPPLALSADHARRFLVRRQRLDPPRALPAAPTSVLEVVRTLGSLQFDPLAVPGARNHDLVLHARIADYRPGWCDAWLYGPPDARQLFEAYNKSLNILPVDELPYFRLAWRVAAERYRERVFGRHAAAVAAVLAHLEREGPLSTTDVARLVPGRVDWHWAPTAAGRAILEALFETGRVGIARREGNRRYYDLIERVLPARLLAAPPASDPDARRHRLLSRHRAVGLMGSSGAAELVVGTGSVAERARALAALVDAGTLLPVTVEGLRGVRYVLAEERALLDETARPARGRAAGVAFVAPLDPLVWDRRLVRELFGFDYVWEVYVPAARRRHGYYVLPVLFGDRLVGRIEPRFERAARVLRVAGLGFEPGFAPLEAEGFVPAFAAALADYARFVGAARVVLPRSRTARALAQALGELAQKLAPSPRPKPRARPGSGAR